MSAIALEGYRYKRDVRRRTPSRVRSYRTRIDDDEAPRPRIGDARIAGERIFGSKENNKVKPTRTTPTTTMEDPHRDGDDENRPPAAQFPQVKTEAPPILAAGEDPMMTANPTTTIASASAEEEGSGDHPGVHQDPNSSRKRKLPSSPLASDTTEDAPTQTQNQNTQAAPQLAPYKTDLARQVNRFSAEELAYLEKKFREQPTPNVVMREQMAQELSKRRHEMEYGNVRSQGWTQTLTQVQIKYWFDHQRRKRKKQLRAFQQQQQQHQQSFYATAGHHQVGFGSPPPGGLYHPGVSVSPVPAFDPYGHLQIKTPANPLVGGDNALKRNSPTGVLPDSAALGMALQSFGPAATTAAMAAASLQQGAGAAVPPQSIDMQSYLKYWQALSFGMQAQNPQGRRSPPMEHLKAMGMAGAIQGQGGTSAAGGSSAKQPNFTVKAWNANEVILPRFEELANGIFVLGGNLRLSFYGEKDDPVEMPLYSAIISEGSFVGRTNSKSFNAGGMMIQAQTQCYVAVIDQE